MAESIDYAAVLADMEEKYLALGAAIAGIKRWQSLRGAEEGPQPAFSGRRPEAIEIRSDSFFGMSMPDAIRKYLSMMKQPRSVSDMTKGLQEGGLPTTAKNLINGVASTLSRMKSDGEVVQVQGKWGLKEWYPGWKEPVAKPGARKRGRPKGSKAQAAKPADKPTSAKLTPEQIEHIKQLHAKGKKPGEIAKEVGLHHFAVMGILRAKKAA